MNFTPTGQDPTPGLREKLTLTLSSSFDCEIENRCEAVRESKEWMKVRERNVSGYLET